MEAEVSAENRRITVPNDNVGQTAGVVDVMAVMRAPLEQYPPSVYQVALLAEAGMSVAVVDAAHRDLKQIEFPRQVRRIRAGTHILFYKEKTPVFIKRVWNAYRFMRKVRRAVREFRPKVVITYDDRACPLVGRRENYAHQPRIISHFHELSLYNRGDGLGAWHANIYCRKFARESDLVIFPDAYRAEIFRAHIGMLGSPGIVMNCPRRMNELPVSKLRERLKSMGFGPGRVVFFQGWLASNRMLEPLVQSMTRWPKDCLLVLAGPASKLYQQSLVELAERMGVGKRLVFTGMVPLMELDSLIVGADVAVALTQVETRDLNFYYMAGASNKRFAYMALGVPQIANHGPGMNEVIQRPGCGLLVNPDSPEEVGRAIRLLLDNDSLRREIGGKGREAHLREFNYEYQFAPVLERMREWTGRMTKAQGPRTKE